MWGSDRLLYAVQQAARNTVIAEPRAKAPSEQSSLDTVAGWTGLEPAASGVTGRRYNQLNYHPKQWRRLVAQGPEGVKEFFTRLNRN